MEINYNIPTDINNDCFYGEYDRTNKTICIGKTLTPKSKMYTLLHECGHAILSLDLRKYRHKYTDLPLKRHWGKYTMYEYVDIVKEEFDAWEEGMKLSQLLKIPLAKKDYIRYAKRQVWTYISECKTRTVD